MCVAGTTSWKPRRKEDDRMRGTANIFLHSAPHRTCSYEEHIIYVFVLFSHNFIINVYHHYCSYSISHSHLAARWRTFPSLTRVCRTTEKREEFGSWEASLEDVEMRMEKESIFPISRDFRISKGYTLIRRGFKKLFSTSPARMSRLSPRLFICRPINCHLSLDKAPPHAHNAGALNLLNYRDTRFTISRLPLSIPFNCCLCWWI